MSGGCNGSGGAGIDTPSSVGDILISGNIVRNIGTSLSSPCNTVQGIYIAGPNNTVINNVVSGAAAIGITQWHGATASAIINNTVFHNQEGILIGDGDGGALPNGSENNYVANNIVYNNSGYGIREYGKVGANNRYVDNLVYLSGSNMSVAGAVSGTISKDPLFVNYQANGSGNYHLQASSPAIGKGTLSSAPSTDIDGNLRGSAVDIGAYEYQGSSPANLNSLVVVTSYSVLKTYSANCDGRAGISTDCNAAVDAFCRAKSYSAGGFGPVEHAGDVAYVVCVNPANAARYSTTFTALHGYQSLCNSSNPMSVECSSAINRFCQSGQSHAAGGYGPLEISGDNVTVGCVAAAGADYITNTSWSTLASYQSGCSGQAAGPTDYCKSAVERRCQELTYGSGSHYIGGYGILEMNNSVAYFSCLKN